MPHFIQQSKAFIHNEIKNILEAAYFINTFTTWHNKMIQEADKGDPIHYLYS